MADIGTVTGAIGAVTGIIALGISIKNYLHVSDMKALDLRLELQKAFNNLDIVLSGIEGYLDYVRESHRRVMAATGRNNSGEMIVFEENFTKDKTRLRGLLSTQPLREITYDRLGPAELEKSLVAVHALHAQLTEIRSKYQRLFESDEERRKEIRAAHQ